MNTIAKALLLTTLAVVTLADATSAAETKRPPNFVFILIDDMGYRDLGCFGGNAAATPNIDRLAAEGLRFNQFYVSSPICSPSRVALTTGQYPGRWRITSFLSNRKEDADRGLADSLDPSAPTLARALKDAGYHTAHVGKWHMGGQRDVNDAPPITAYGFTTSLTSMEGLGERVLAKFEDRPNGKPFNHGPTMSNAAQGGPIIWEDRQKVSDRYVDRAIKAIDAAAAKKQPFYLNLWPDDVHSPWQPSPEFRGDGSPEALYLGVLRELDRTLGRVFDHVRADPELRDNTIILLASDNGHEGGRNGGGTLRGSKGTLYEGGIRSPLIVWGPGRLATEAKAGSGNDRTVITGIDFAPTLLGIAGVSVPGGWTFDGVDMSPALLGKSDAPRKSPVMWVRPPDRPGPPKRPLPDLAIRDGNWKLLVKRDGSNAELFDVVKDPDEAKNVAAANRDVAKRLGDTVIAWDKSVAASAKGPTGKAKVKQ